MMRSKKKLIYTIVIGVLLALISSVILSHYVKKRIGQKIDEYNGVGIYDNGYIWNVSGRNQTEEGYNVGLKYQCVEFVKRYYLERFGHKMPNSKGNAKDFFDKDVKNGEINLARGLIQYVNGGGSKPQVEDIIVFAPSIVNRYGHIAIVSKVDTYSIEIVQQNFGFFSSSRETFDLLLDNQHVRVKNDRVLGWLRKQ